MRNETTRWEQLAEDLYAAAFAMLDAEPEYSGLEAGRIATEVQRAFLRQMRDDAGDIQDDEQAAAA